MNCKILLLMCSLPFFCEIANAAKIRDFPLEEKVGRSDLVIVGKVANGTPVIHDGDEYVWVKPELALKGTAPQRIMVQSRGKIAERSTGCCKAGGKYLFFLSNLGKNRFWSEFGFYGIYRVN